MKMKMTSWFSCCHLALQAIIEITFPFSAYYIKRHLAALRQRKHQRPRMRNKWSIEVSSRLLRHGWTPLTSVVHGSRKITFTGIFESIISLSHQIIYDLSTGWRITSWTDKLSQFCQLACTQALGGTVKIRVNQTKVQDVMRHPVSIIYDVTNYG